MKYSRQRPSSLVWLLLLSATAFLACGTARATVPVTSYVVINPIDVCNTSGPSGTTGCAPFNFLSQSPNPSQATSTTPIGFVDTATNVNITRAIWLQAGIDVTFLPILEYNNTTDQSIGDVTCANMSGCMSLTSATSLTSDHFKALSSGTPGPLAPGTSCKSNCKVPLASSRTNAINMFFVNNISAKPLASGAFFGFAWLNGNGVAIAANVFSFSSLTPSRFDTLAHEIGHNLNLDHTTFGAGTLCSGTPSPFGCNVMDAGNMRIVPNSSGCSSPTLTTTGGALFDLDTALCGTSTPLIPQADQLILGNGTSVQQGQALLSGFMNPVPNVNATAGGGVAAATIATTTTTTATASTSDPISFTVTYPKFAHAGGRSADEFIFAVVLALPEGFVFGTNLFTQTGGSAQVFSFEQLNGNNGQGNSNCLKPLSGAPSIQCLEIDFVPGTFTTNTSVSFTSVIINKSTGLPATLAELACTPPAPLHCLDLTDAFSDLLATSSAFVVRDLSGNLTANSQLPDEGVPSTIVDPANFPSVANLNPPLTFGGFTQTACTLSGTSKSCPPPKGGNPVGPD